MTSVALKAFACVFLFIIGVILLAASVDSTISGKTAQGFRRATLGSACIAAAAGAIFI
jgi:hypothetical protein